MSSGLFSMFYKLFEIKNSGAVTTLARSETLATRNKSAIKNENISNKDLAKELHKVFIRKFNKRKVHSIFIDNIWGADHANMLLISKLNKRLRFLLCVIYIVSK